MTETLEQRVNAPQQEEKEDKKPVSTLESVVGELGDLFNLGIGVGAPAAGFAITGNAGVLATSAAYVAATPGSINSKIVRNESLSGAIFGTFAHYTLYPLRFLGNLAKVIYTGLWPIPANAFYMAEDHLVKNLSPKGMYKKFKENYLKVTKKAYLTVVPLNILSALLLPPQYMVAAIAVASYIFRKFVVGGKGEEPTDKTPYLVAAPRVIGKLARNSVKGLLDAAYAIGSGISDLYKAAPKPPAPEPKPA